MLSFMRWSACLMPVWMLAATGALPVAAQPAPPQTGVIVIEQTLETAPAYTLVHVQLWQGDRVLEGAAGALNAIKGLEDLDDLDQLLDDNGAEKEQSFTAFLDTGASAHVLSAATVARFGITAPPDAVYHETGLHGDVAMGVTDPYSLALAGATGKLFDEPVQFGWAGQDVRFLVNRAQPNALVQLAMGEINVIGMPAIGNLVIEIDPAPMGQVGDAGDAADRNGIDGLQDLDLLNNLDAVGVGPAIRLYDGAYQVPAFDLVIPLKLTDFSRQMNRADQGPKPDLAPNFVIENIVVELAGKQAGGNWLLDTGAPASIISTKLAIAVGLYDSEGQPTRPADFSLPLGGIAGDIEAVPGFRIDKLQVPTDDGAIIEYRQPYVLVRDISTTLDSGEVITLDGVFGTNLLLPTVSGLGMGLPTEVAPGPFARIWIDGPRSRLLLELKKRAPENPGPR